MPSAICRAKEPINCYYHGRVMRMNEAALNKDFVTYETIRKEIEALEAENFSEEKDQNGLFWAKWDSGKQSLNEENPTKKKASVPVEAIADPKLSTSWLEAVNKKWASDPTSRNYGYELGVKYGRRFAKIIVVADRFGRKVPGGMSVFGFVEIKTGNLIKAATWNAPQLNSDGKPAVRYNLNDPEDFKIAVDLAEFSGGFLYDGARENLLAGRNRKGGIIG